MSEWWTYSLSDFLLFAPRTYYRLFELYNASVWPLHVLALALGAAILVLLRRAGAARGRVIAALLAGVWLWVAWAYFLEQYATINWAAEYFAWGFALEALLLATIGVARPLDFRPSANLAGRAGIALFVFALVLQPLIGPLAGRSWTAAEIFAIAPDPTVTATLALLLLARSRAVWLLLPLPVLWCAVTGATAWAMKSPDALVMPAVALLVLALAVFARSPKIVPPSAPASAQPGFRAPAPAIQDNGRKP